jgi:hypothetical protein
MADDWRCAGCGIISPDRQRMCDCPTNVVSRRGGEFQWKRPPDTHWAVTVSRGGEEIVTIESNCLSGSELSPEDEDTIRTAASHLLAFIGDPAPPSPSLPESPIDG